MSFKVELQYPDGTTEEDDEVFETEAEAHDHGLYLLSCHTAGAEILHLSNPGDYPLSDDELDYEILEVDE